MNSVKFPNIREVEDTAAQWVAKVDRGLSSGEELELGSWLEASPAHGEALVKCASMWDLLDVLSPIAKLMPMETLQLDGGKGLAESKASEASAATIRAPYLQWAAAATLVLGIGFYAVTGLLIESGPMANNQPADPKGQIYRTAIGEISKVKLSDGSELQLNTDSEVLVSFNQSVRQLELLSGEVFFHVARDPSAPFVVNVGDDQVIAVGTAFSIDARPGLDTEVLVTEGKVKVNLNAENPVQDVTDLFLTPGQSVTLMGNRPEVRDQQDHETMLSWREGMLIFQGESLAEAIIEIDRYTSLSFTIMDEDVAKIPVGGYFKTGDTEQLLLVLKQNFDVHSTRIGEEILLHRAR